MAISIDFSPLAQLININSYTKNKVGVDATAEVYTSWMQALGFEAICYQRAEIGNHMHYVSPKTAGKKVLLLGHFDTVFPAETFEGFSEDEHWVYGPGVCDMKGGNFVAYEALKQVKQVLGTISNIDVLMVSDEETGSDDSKFLTAELASQYDCCLVFEAAGPQDEIVVARKGVATFTIEVEGKAAHAGNHYSEGIDANLAAAHMVIDLAKLTNLSLGTTVNAGKITGGIGANTISPKAGIKVEARFTNIVERERILASINVITKQPRVSGVKVEVSGGLQRDVMESCLKQVALIEEIENILDENLKLESRGGVSDANVVSGSGIPTLDGFGPYGDGDHTIHERANKSSFVKRINQVSEILIAFNGVTDLSCNRVA